MLVAIAKELFNFINYYDRCFKPGGVEAYFFSARSDQ